MRIIEFFEKNWIESKQSVQYTTHNRTPFFNIAKKYLANCDKILDIGSGSGNFIKFLGKNDIYAIDGNKDSVNNLQNIGINAVHAILPDIPFPDNFFNGLHASHILEHLYPEDFYRTLREIDRVLKPGGILVISSPMLWEGFYSDLSHIKPYNPEIFKKYLCGDLSYSSTRLQIGGYRIKSLTYRYKFEEIYPIVLRHCNIFNILSLLFVKLLKKIGIGYFRKSGYTVVLKKLKNE